MPWFLTLWQCIVDEWPTRSAAGGWGLVCVWLYDVGMGHEWVGVGEKEGGGEVLWVSLGEVYSICTQHAFDPGS